MSNKKNDIDENTIIYQYYDLNTFYSVIKNREIWFSDVKKMNDANEDKQIFLFLKEELKRIMNEINEKEKQTEEYKNASKFLEEIESLIHSISKESDKNYKKFCNRYYQEIKKCRINVDNNALRELKKKRNKIGALLLIKNFEKSSKFISCFSKIGDLLGQWRSYADDGKGIAIGYNLGTLEEILKTALNNNSKYDDQMVTVGTINYINRNNLDVDKIFDFYDKKKLKELDTFIEELLANQDLKDEIGRDVMVNIISDTRLFNMIINLSEEFTEEDVKILEYIKNRYKDEKGISTFFKHSGFEEECEVRILINKNNDSTSSTKKDENTEGNKTYVSETDFRISKRNNEFIEYLKLVLTKVDFIKVISKIIIGPNNQITEKDIEKILLNNLFNDIDKSKGDSLNNDTELTVDNLSKKIEIEKSTIPYRN